MSFILLKLLWNGLRINFYAKYSYITFSACPSHVSLDVSNDTQVLVPVCEPILTSGMTVIKLKLQDPQIAQVKLSFPFFLFAYFFFFFCVFGCMSWNGNVQHRTTSPNFDGEGRHSYKNGFNKIHVPKAELLGRSFQD